MPYAPPCPEPLSPRHHEPKLAELRIGPDISWRAARDRFDPGRPPGRVGAGDESDRRAEQMVEANGGTVEVSSELGAGTVFTIRIPA